MIFDIGNKSLIMILSFFSQLTVPHLGNHHRSHFNTHNANALRSNGKILSCVAKSY